MNKAFTLGLLLVLALPLLVLAQAGPATSCTMTSDVGITGCPSSGSTCDFTTNNLCGICCVMNAIFTVTNWIFFALIAVVALLVIWGGFTIATAAGAPDKVNAGRNYILFAMLGFGVALLARAIPSVVKALLGVT
jgi:hypothetical protein